MRPTIAAETPTARKLTAENARKERREAVRDWVAASVAISAGTLGLMLVNNAELWSELFDSGAGASIGKVTRIAGQARFRIAEGLVWQDMASEERKIRDGDSIFTATDGKAQVVLEDGKTFEILPGALVVFKRPAVDPEQGMLGRLRSTVTRAAATEGFKIEVKQGRVRHSGRDMGGDIQTGSESLELALRSAAPAITRESERETRSAMTNANVTAPGNVSQAVEATGVAEHGSAEVVGPEGLVSGEPDGSGRVEVKFVWNLPYEKFTKSYLAKSVALEIQRIGESRVKRMDLVPWAQTALDRLEPGRYRWRLRWKKDDREMTSDWRTISALALVAPQPVEPLAGAAFVSSSQKVGFRWKPSGPFRSEYEIKKDNGADGGILSADEATGAEQRLAPGKYGWRVRSITAEGMRSSWSEWREFSITAPEPIQAREAAPQPASRPTGAPETQGKPAIPRESDLSGEPKRPESSAASAPSSVQRTDAGARAREKEETVAIEEVKRAPKPAPAAPIIEPKEMPSRLQAIVDAARERRMRGGAPEGAGTRADGSADPAQLDPGKIHVMSAIESVSREEGLVVGGERKDLEKTSFELRWHPVPGASSYRVEVFTPDESTLMKAEVLQPRLPVEVSQLEKGEYKYRVTAEVGGKQIESKLLPIQIEIAPPLLIDPAPGNAQSPDRPIVFVWSRSSLTKEYWLQISRDRTFFRDVVVDIELSRNVETLKIKDQGKYYWRVRASTGSRDSKWSQVSTFEIR